MSPGYDLCPSVSSVVPVFTLARTKASIEAAELSGIAARRIRPDRVSRYFARFRPGLAWFVPRSITSTAPAIRIFPDSDADRRRTPPSYYILTNLGQRDEPLPGYGY